MIMLAKPSLCYSILQRAFQIHFRNGISSLVSSSLASDVCNGKPVSCVDVQWEDGKKMTFSPLHLRDSCRCSACFDSESTFQRRFSSKVVLTGVKPVKTWISDDLLLNVKWGDDHESSYSSSRLLELCKPIRKQQIEYIDSTHDIPRFNFEEILKKKSTTKEWLQTLKRTGLAVIHDVPRQTKEIRKIAKIISHLRISNYGEEFQIRWEPTPSSNAFTSDAFPLHTDLTYYDYMPGIQLLHCIQQAATGGANTFSDGFKAADMLKNDHPDSFKLLSSVDWNFHDIGIHEGWEHHQASYKPVIQLDVYGNPRQIAFSDHGRADLHGHSLEKTHMLYEAFLQFANILHCEDLVVHHRVTSGECITMDNRRILHGRESFSTTCARHLEGGYIDWDEANSFIRITKIDG
ncbi:Uncharacterised protein g4835 [Pycnogonum litorale]